MRILVTGGAGYIGSHTLVSLLEAGHDAVVVDNHANSKPEALRRVEALTGRTVEAHAVDAADRAALDRVFRGGRIDAAIHFAGHKAVGESVKIPLAYYRNNLDSTLSLVEVMAEHGCFRLVFSSSATVYGDPQSLPIREELPLSATNPYGRTKLFIEEILRDVAVADKRWKIALLRYFNPVGAHPSGRIGEDPNGIPNNLFPFIAQVAVGRRPELSIFGGDYPTRDGTGERDYIHVCDLAEGHVAAVEKIEALDGAEAINLGTGTGYTVLEAVKAFSEAAGRPVPHRIVARRPGDIAACYADPARAKAKLGWTARRGLADMCRDHWRWQSGNPNGYE